MTVTNPGDNPPMGGSPNSPTSQYQPNAFPPISGTDGTPPPEPVEESGGSRVRWLIAGLATILVVGIVIALILVYGQRPAATSALPEYAPANSALYAELRLDLPGDQRESVVEFMSKFPGFADPSTFEQKINDSLDQLLLNTGSGLSWTQDIEPWFGGQIAVFGSMSGEGVFAPSITAVLSVKDRTRLDQLIAARTAGGATTGHYYREIPVWTDASGGGAFTVTNEAFILSLRSEDLHTALDVKAGAAPNLATNTDFSESMATLSGDRLAAVYIDADALGDALENLGGALGPGVSPFDLGLQTGAMSGKVLVELRAESDHVVLTSRARPAPGTTPQIVVPDGPTTIADRMPPDSMAYVGLHGTGVIVKTGIQQMLALAGQSAVDTTDFDQIEEYLGMPMEEFLDFLDETAISFTAGPEGTYSGGLIGTVSDEAVARERLGRVVSAIRLAITFGEVPLPVTIEEVPHGAATLTVFRLEGQPGMDLPFSSISYTVTGGQLLIGVDSFVTDALDRDPANSLAAQPRFGAALDAAGADNGAVFYVDIGRARGAFEELMPDEQRARYEAEIRQYVAPLSQFIFTSSMDGEDTVTRMLLFVE
jgi:hypothetical protein